MTADVQSPAFEPLIPGLLRQDREAEEAFYRIAYSRLRAWAQYRFGVSRDAQEDFVLEVIEKALGRLGSFHPELGKFTTWIFAVARNHRLDQLRKLQFDRDPLHEAMRDDVLEWLETPLASGNEGDGGGPRHPAMVAACRERLARLRSEDLEFLELACISTLTSAEIGAQTGMSAAGVRKKKERILHQLHSET
jgi:RNA polymerase sigma-70 factor (ECF subfamily)